MNLKKNISSLIFLILLASSVFIIRRGYLKFGHKNKFDIERIRSVNNILPVAVIGSGPAGLSAALYVARGNMYAAVFQGKVPGGQLTNTSYVENWPGINKMMGADIVGLLKKQAENFGAAMSTDIITDVDFSIWPYKLYTDSSKEIEALWL